MNALVMKLAPREQVYVNGTLIENGDRRSTLNILSPRANILRVREMIDPNQADLSTLHNTIYRLQQFVAGIKHDHEQLKAVLAEASHYLPDWDLEQEFAVGRGYQVLKALRKKLPSKVSV